MKKITARVLSNLLLASPFSEDSRACYRSTAGFFGKEILSTDKWRKDYLSEIYAFPYFIKGSNVNFPLTDEQLITDDEKTIKRHGGKEAIRAQYKKYGDFHESLLGHFNETDEQINEPADGEPYRRGSLDNALKSPLYLVIGSTGCGKSHFVHKLLEKGIEEIHPYFVSFEVMGNYSVSFLFENTNYDMYEITPVNYFILLLVEHIHYCFCPAVYNKDDYLRPTYPMPSLDFLKNRISLICDTYKEYFFDRPNGQWKDLPEFRRFFTELGNIPKDKTTVQEIADAVLELTKNLKSTLPNSGTRKEDKSLATCLAGLFYRLNFCLIESGCMSKNKVVLAIDNIEYAISGASSNCLIGESDIQFILEVVNLSAKDFRTRIAQMETRSAYIKSNPVAILLAMRESTYGILQAMRRPSHNNMENAGLICDINVSDWYAQEDILVNKIKYFTGCDSVEKLLENRNYGKSEAVMCFYNVVRDRSYSAWALDDFINDLYNNSKQVVYQRVISGFLLHYEPAEIREIEYDNQQYNPLQFFNLRWKELVEQRKDHQNHTDERKKQLDAFAHLCRKYIISLLLKYINMDKVDKSGNKYDFFSDLCHVGGTDEISSYARRILLYLLRHKQEQEQKQEDMDSTDDDGRFVSAGELIYELVVHNKQILPSNTSISNAHKDGFYKVIYNLNRGIIADQALPQMIYVEVPDGTMFSRQRLSRLIQDDWELYQQKNRTLLNEPRVEAKITNTGEMYAFFMPDFEYFSCRYSKASPPLLAIDTNDKLRTLLEEIFSKTMECLDNVYKFEGTQKNSWVYKIGDKEQRHIERLLTSQARYLAIFGVYLRSPLCSLDKNVKKDMIRTLKEYFDKYEECFFENERKYFYSRMKNLWDIGKI